MIAAASGALVAAQASTPSAQTPPPQAEPAEEPVERAIDRVHLRDDGRDRLTIPVRVDGEGPYQFLIDTGSQGTILSDRVVATLGKRPSGTVTVVSTASRAEVDTVRVSSLEFARRSVDRITAPVLQYDHLGVDGILGLDALQDLRVLIDFRAGTMDVEDVAESPDAATPANPSGYEIVVRARRLKGQMVITDALIDGVEAAVVIDTGAQSSIGNLALLESLRAREREMVEGTDVLGSRYQGRVAYMEEMLLGRLRLGELAIAFVDGPAFAELGYGDRPALLLGIGNLRRLDRLAIDFHTSEVLFDLPANLERKGSVVRKRRASRLQDGT